MSVECCISCCGAREATPSAGAALAYARSNDLLLRPAGERDESASAPPTDAPGRATLASPAPMFRLQLGAHTIEKRTTTTMRRTLGLISLERRFFHQHPRLTIGWRRRIAASLLTGCPVFVSHFETCLPRSEHLGTKNPHLSERLGACCARDWRPSSHPGTTAP